MCHTECQSYIQWTCISHLFFNLFLCLSQVSSLQLFLQCFDLTFMFLLSQVNRKFVEIQSSFLLILTKQLKQTHEVKNPEPFSLFFLSCYTKARDTLKVWIAFFTSSTSISINFPVLDDIIMHFFSSACGTNLFPFSSEPNNAILHNKRNSFVAEIMWLYVVWFFIDTFHAQLGTFLPPKLNRGDLREPIWFIWLIKLPWFLACICKLNGSCVCSYHSSWVINKSSHLKHTIREWSPQKSIVLSLISLSFLFLFPFSYSILCNDLFSHYFTV